MIFERQVGSDKNKHDIFCAGRGSQGYFCYLRNEQLNPTPPHFLWFTLKVRCCSIFGPWCVYRLKRSMYWLQSQMLLWSSMGFYLVVCILYIPQADPRECCSWSLSVCRNCVVPVMLKLQNQSESMVDILVDTSKSSDRSVVVFWLTAAWQSVVT